MWNLFDVQEKPKRRAHKIRSFAVDEETDRLNKAGAKLERKNGNPSFSNFLRVAIKEYFDKRATPTSKYEDVSKLFNVKVSTIRKWVRRRYIPCISKSIGILN